MCEAPDTAGAVVVLCDGSDGGRSAVAAGTREAARRGATLVLLAIADHTPYWPDTPSWVVHAQRRAIARARAADRAAADLAAHIDPAVVVATLTVSDLMSPALAGLAGEAALLVMGWRREVPVAGFTLGCTRSELLRRFRCPVLVAGAARPGPAPWGRPAATVAGIDNDRTAAVVLAAAADAAAVRDQALIVVHAVSPTESVDRDHLGQIWRLSSEALHHTKRPTGFRHRLVVTQDRGPARALLRHTQPGDLLVLGSRGRRALAGLVPGSVSRTVVEDAACDVLIIPPPATATTTSRLWAPAHIAQPPQEVPA